MRTTHDTSTVHTPNPGGPMTAAHAFHAMLLRVLRAPGQSRSARTVELFGWLMLVEGLAVGLAPHFAAAVLQLPALSEQAANYFRLVGFLVTGLGILYTVSGRLNAGGFTFASLIDRPLSPIAMALLWFFGIIPGPLALMFALTDLATFLWTLHAWAAEARAGTAG